MDNKYLEQINNRSDLELKNIVINFQNYQGSLINAAKNELSRRGVALTEVENAKLEENKIKRTQEAILDKKSNPSWGLFYPDWKRNIITEIDAPELYSRQVINTFSILFSVLFGGILLSLNLKSTGNKKAILPVMAYSVIYTSLMMIGLSLVEKRSTVFAMSLNMLGSIALYDFFWRKYIGKDLKYRTKAFWIPLIIGIAITAFFIAVAILGQ
jgi:hypothetical protein